MSKWISSREWGSPSFRRQATPDQTLEILASGSRCYGSWRTDVYLDQGQYQLVGRVKIIGGEYGTDVVSPGATIRVSGVRTARMVKESPEWQTITYDFPVTGREDLTLVCEFRATKGTAIFDAASLKLVRKGKQPLPNDGGQ